MRFNKLVPELSVADLDASLKFYLDILGFKIEYQREEKRFAFLSLQGSQIMLDGGNSEENSPWYTGELEYPRGRGIHFQIGVKDIIPILNSLKGNNYPIKEQPKDYWYRQDKKLLGMRGLLVMDPDGYLIMFNQDLGKKNIN